VGKTRTDTWDVRQRPAEPGERERCKSWRETNGGKRSLFRGIENVKRFRVPGKTHLREWKKKNIFGRKGVRTTTPLGELGLKTETREKQKSGIPTGRG